MWPVQTAWAPLVLLAAAASAATDSLGSALAPRHPEDIVPVLELKEDGPNVSNSSEALQKEIAYLKKEIQHEEWRIEAAKTSASEANATWLAAEEELHRLKDETESAKERTARAWQEVAEVRAQIEAIKRAQEYPEGPVVAWLAGLPHQQALAVALGIAGLLSIVGPSTFTRAFLAITGSAVGGLLVGSAFEFFLGGASWLSAVRRLLQGTGLWFGYIFWAAVFLCGVARWLTGFKCHASDFEDGEEENGGGLAAPLLATEAPAAAQSRSRPGGRPRGAA